MIIIPLSYYNIVTGAGQCAVDAINATPAGPLARVCLHVPGEIAWDDCQCGSFTQTAGAWLWSDNARTPVPYIGDENNGCGPKYLGLDVTAMVLRCVAQPRNEELSPSCTALNADSRQWHYDAFALRRGIVCCLRAMLTAGTVEAFEITAQTPAGPQGMCTGSQLTYRVWLPNCDCV